MANELPPELAAALRPALPELAQEIIAAIGRDVPDYARPLYVALGRGEMRAGRSLDALLSAYRIGARLAWEHFVAAGEAAGHEPRTLYRLASAIFDYIDGISAESVEGFTQERAAAEGERQRRRRARARLLTRDDVVADEVRDLARQAGWSRPATLAALVVGEVSGEEPDADRVASRLGGGAIAVAEGALTIAWVPDPQAPGRRARSPRATTCDRARGPACARRCERGSITPARSRAWPASSTCTRRPSATASPSCASCSASASTTPTPASSWRWRCVRRDDSAGRVRSPAGAVAGPPCPPAGGHVARARAPGAARAGRRCAGSRCRRRRGSAGATPAVVGRRARVRSSLPHCAANVTVTVEVTVGGTRQVCRLRVPTRTRLPALLRLNTGVRIVPQKRSGPK